MYDVGSTSTFVANQYAISAVITHGRLIVVGTTDDALGGTDITAIRLVPFDGIFKNGFDPAIVID